jgi:hypothetical protein
MARDLVLVGKQGPAFGDRPSHTTVKVRTFEEDIEGSIFENRITNWPHHERADALRAVFSPFRQGLVDFY